MTIITAPDAPAAIGPYSHAVTAGRLIFSSGQIPLDPKRILGQAEELVGILAKALTHERAKPARPSDVEKAATRH